jgi:WD40 repeat protein
MDQAHTRTVRSVAWSIDGEYLASAGFDGTIAVWTPSVEDWECVATLEGHENEAKSVAFSADGQYLATCGRDKSVWVWQMLENDEFECVSVLQEHAQDVKRVLWHPTRTILFSCSYDDTIKVYKEQMDDFVCVETLSGHASTVWDMDMDVTGGRLVSVGADGALCVWRHTTVTASDAVFGHAPTQEWQLEHTIQNAHTRAIYSVSWSKTHGHILTGGGDNLVKLWRPHLDGWQCVEEMNVGADVNCVKWFPTVAHANWFAVATDDDVVSIHVM